MRIVVISPVRNEAEHLPLVIRSIMAQQRPPDRWILVDDGSEDGTAELVLRASAGIAWIDGWHAPQDLTATDRLAVAAEARAFHWALDRLGDDPWDLLGKLDGDIVLAPEHFSRLESEFRADPRLGIAGCWLDEERAETRVPMQMPAFHVNGAVKLWRRTCWEEIGGLEPTLGWDTIDETRARMGGWRTRALHDLRGLHLRPSGSVGGQLRGRARHGECVWILHYPLPVVLARTARLAARSPPLVHGAAYLAGYLRGLVTRRRRVADPAFRAYVRAEQYDRVWAVLRAVVQRRWRLSAAARGSPRARSPRRQRRSRSR